MKYELMRAYYCKDRHSFVLDLYNMHYNKGVELHYYLGGHTKKYDIDSIIPILHHKRISRQLHTIDYWDKLIKLRPTENKNE